jgi:hypothetical protein
MFDVGQLCQQDAELHATVLNISITCITNIINNIIIFIIFISVYRWRGLWVDIFRQEELHTRYASSDIYIYRLQVSEFIVHKILKIWNNQL